ncbi:NUDIX domain-containing protein [Phytohabitans kaempferiae]|uniref:NUDIX domain-containing protein n=1 Tax=Phytohabitans kaempferiae TaxID=1620943 RepID=A0ABV6MDD3_9ACTN
MLLRRKCGFAADLVFEAEKSVKDEPFRIARGEFHETTPAPQSGAIALTVAATAHATRNDSLVLALVDTPDVIQNRRSSIPSLAPFVERFDDLYRMESGRADRWASFVFLIRDGRLLMIRTFRNPSLWQPVGGQAIADDADSVETAIREVAEETSIRIVREDLIPLGERPRDKGFGSVFGWCAETESDPSFQVSEVVEARWVRLHDAFSLPTFGATKAFLSTIAQKVSLGPT